MLRGLLSRGLAVAALMALVGVLGGLLAACGGASTSSGTTTEVFRDTTGDLSGFLLANQRALRNRRARGTRCSNG